MKGRNEKGQFTKGFVPKSKESLIGQRFGRLVVIADAEPKVQPSGQTKRQVKCKCDCGNECVVRAECLRNGTTRSCGCVRREKSRERLKKDFNDYEICGDYVKVFNERHDNYFIIDLDDFEKVKTCRWCEDGCGYWVTGTVIPHRRVHQFLLGNNYDHKDGNPSNNRRSNLRKATDAQNGWNRAKNKSNKAGYKGVYLHHSKYQARICKDGVRENLGAYETPEEAARAYDKRAKELFGEWARLNFPEEETENENEK